MSTSVDERVVRMEFENEQFEKGIRESTKSLEEFEKSLQFSDATKGLDEVEKKISSMDISPLADSVSEIGVRFNAMQIIATTALEHITQKAINAGENLMRSLTIEQVSSGWQKYASKTSSVQTMMASLGDDADIDRVEGQLDKLSWYADETSASFEGMVQTVSDLMSANNTLEDSVTMIQGLNSAASLAGVSSEKTQYAINGFVKAISNGTMRMEQWQSVQTSGLAANTQFKQTILDTAVAMGTLRKNADGTYATIGKGTEVSLANFTSAFSEGWMTAQVMVGSLKEFGSFSDNLYEAIGMIENAGGYLGATDLLSAIDAFKEMQSGVDRSDDLASWAEDANISVESLCEILEVLSDDIYTTGLRSFRTGQEAKTFGEAINAIKVGASGAWSKIFQSIFGNYEEAKVLWTKLANWGYEVFVEPLNGLSALIDAWAEWRKVTGEDGKTTDILISSFEQLGPLLSNIVSPFKTAIAEVFNISDESILNSLKNLTTNFAEGLSRLVEYTEKLKEPMTNFLRGLLSPIKVILALVKGVLKLVKPIIGIFKPLFSLFVKGAGSIGGFVDSIVDGIVNSKIFTFVINALTKCLEFVATVVTEACESFDSFIDVLKETQVFKFFSAQITKLQSLFDTSNGLNKGLATFTVRLTTLWQKIKRFLPSFEEIQDIGRKVWKVISSISSVIIKFAEGIGGLLAPYVEKVVDVFASVYNAIKNFIIGLLEADDPVEYIGESIKTAFDNIRRAINEKIDFDKAKESIRSFVDKVKEILSDLKDTLGSFSIKDWAFLAFAAAMIIVCTKLFKVADVVSGAVEKIGGLATSLTDSLKDPFGLKKVFESFGAQILALTVAFIQLSRIPTDKLWAVTEVLGVIAVGLLAISSIAGLVTSAIGKGNMEAAASVLSKMGTALIGAAIAVDILAKANIDGLIVKAAVMFILIAELIAGFVAIAQYGQIKSPLKTVGSLIVVLTVVLTVCGLISLLDRMGLKGLYKTIISVSSLIVGTAKAMGIVSKSVTKDKMFAAIKSIALLIAAVGLTAAGIGIIIRVYTELTSEIDSFDISGTLGSIISFIIFIGAIMAAVFILKKMATGEVKDTLYIALAFLMIAAAIDSIILSISVIKGNLSLISKYASELRSIVLTLLGVTIAISFAGKMIKDEGKGLIKLAGAVALTAVAFAMMVASILLLNYASPETIKGAAPILLAIGACLAGMAIALGFAQKLAGEKKIKTGYLISIIVSFVAMAIVALGLGLIPEGIMWKGIGIMGVLALILGGIAVLLGLGLKLSKGKAGVGMMLGIILSIVTLAAVCAIFGTYQGSIDQGLGVTWKLAAILAGMALIVGLGIKMAGGAKGLAGALAIVVTIVAIAGVLLVMQGLGLDLPTLAGMALGILLVLGVFVLLGIIASKLIVVDVVLIAMSAAMLIAAAAIAVLSLVLPILSENLIYFMDTLVGYAANTSIGKVVLIVLGLTAAFLLFGASAIVVSIGFGLLAAAVLLLGLGFYFISQAGYEAGDMFIYLVECIGQAISKFSYGIGEVLAFAGKIIVASIAAGIAGALFGIAAIGLGLFVAVCTAATLVVGLFAAALNGVASGAERIQNMGGIGGVIDSLFGKNKNLAAATADAEMTAGEAVTAYAQSVEDSADNMDEAADSASDYVEAVNAVTEATENADEGNVLDKLLGGNGFDLDIAGGNIGEMLNFGNLDSDLTSSLGGVDLSGFTDSFSTMFGGSLNDGASFAVSNFDIDGLFGGIQEKIGGLTGEQTDGVGTSISEVVVGGMTSDESKAAISDASVELVDVAGSKLSEEAQNNEGITKSGVYMSQGVAAGMMSEEGTGSIATAAQYLVEFAKQTIMDTAQIASPSKLFAGLGFFIDAGFAKGIEDNTGMVTDATDSLSNSAINGMSYAMAAVSNAVASDDNFRPVITPVLDLSNVNEGSRQLNTMLSSSRAYSASLGINADGKYSDDSQVVVLMRNILDEIRAGGKVYLDGDVIAGTVNRRLGAL